MALRTLTFLECGQAVISLNVRVCDVQGDADGDDVLMGKRIEKDGGVKMTTL